MQGYDVEYCQFREARVLVMTWNAGASTPGSLKRDDRDHNFFRELLQDSESPDVLVFGFQELIDLEDKKLTASELVLPGRCLHLRVRRELLQRQQEEGSAGTGAYEPTVPGMAGLPHTQRARIHAGARDVRSAPHVEHGGPLQLHLCQERRTREDPASAFVRGQVRARRPAREQGEACLCPVAAGFSRDW